MATRFRLIGLLVCVGMSAPARAQAAEIRARFSEPMVPIGGRRLAQPFTFTFTTPTVHLLRTDWYRQNGRYDQPILVALRFIGAHTVTARDTRGHQSDAVILVK